jgi:outer membrane immunogenic protein
MRKSLLAAATLLFSFSFEAVAADLKTPAFKAAAAPYYDPYTGFYAGAEIGYGFNLGATSCVVAGFGPCDLGTLAAAPQGFVGGGFLGWGTRLPGLLAGLGLDGYFGIEGNGDIANLKGSAAMPGLLFGGAGAVADVKNDWLASARARFGLIYQNVMFYGTVGWGWGSTTFASDVVISPTTAAPLTASASMTQNGLAWGGGVEFPWFFGQGWKARLQYLQYDFGAFSIPCTTIDCASVTALTQKDRIDTITVGLSYKF